jgi:AmmeMemoRadiSam system protein A
MTGADDRACLLQLARDAIAAHVTGAAPPAYAACPQAAAPGAAFVTLRRQGNLRGCIGHVEVDEPLGRVIVRGAVAAASADPRFPPIAAAELPDLEIELSILGPLEPITTPDEIEIGRHGLVVERGRYRGLLLPQVAPEWGWDRETFLAQTCHKAGLPRDAWKQGAKIWRFEAEVFGEGGTGR